MPAGRPTTTGTSPQVTFRARGRLAERLEQRRTIPDLRNEPAYGGPVPAAGEAPKAGTIAARDLAAYYDLWDAELAEAAAQLTRAQVMVILQAVWSLLTDATWITNTPQLLAAEVEDAYADDEEGPDEDRLALATTIRSWPRLRALAALEACLTVRDGDDTDLEAALAAVGLIVPDPDEA